MKLRIVWAVIFMIPAFVSNAQTDTLRIHTSAQCGTCKKKLEHDMAYVKGVKSVVLDLSNKELMVVYNSDKTTPEKLRIAVTKIGYDADSIPAVKKAYEDLNDCCKKGGHD